MSTLGSRRELEQAVISALGEVAERCVDGDGRNLEWDEIVHVSDFHVGESLACEAKLASPDEGFEAAIFNTFKAIGRRSMQYLDQAGTPTEAVSLSMRNDRKNSGGRDWIGDYLLGADLTERVQVATRAVTWLTRTLDVLGPDGVAGMRADQKVDWWFPGRGLRLNGRIDLVAGTGTARIPHIVVPSRSAAWEAKVGFLTLLWCLRNPVPDRVEVLVHASGERYSVQPEDVVEQAIEQARITTHALSHRETGPLDLARTASFFTCAGCAWQEDCVEHAALAELPSVRGGIRLATN